MPYKDIQKKKYFNKIYREANRDKAIAYSKKYYIDNRDKFSQNSKKYYQDNKDRIKEYNKNYHAERSSSLPRTFKTDAEKKEYKSKWYLANRERIAISAKIRYENNKSKKKAYDIEYNKRNADAIRSRKRSYTNHQLKNNPLFKLKQSLRHRIYLAITEKGYSKKGSTDSLLGASILVVKDFIESKFIVGMNWGNHGEWHIDHKIPLASAKNKEELIKLFHYTNLQPLWAKHNLSKSKKMPVNI